MINFKKMCKLAELLRWKINSFLMYLWRKQNENTRKQRS